MNSCMILTSNQTFVIGCVSLGIFLWAIVCVITKDMPPKNMRTRTSFKIEILLGVFGLCLFLWLMFSPNICSNIIQIKGV